MKLVFAALFFILMFASPVYGADHAVVLLYHHVSTNTPASTSVSPEVFRQHLEYLDAKDYNVLPLSQVLNTLAESGTLPDRTVSITFDDAYRSILDQAMPMLKERDWPFTIFVNTLAIDRGYRNYLNWNDLRKLLGSGAEIGNHSQSHAHLVRRLEGESEQQWKDRVTTDIDSAKKRLKEELGIDANMFAYPYGEHTPELQKIVKEGGYFGIAQQSGAVGHDFNRWAVPRFPMATSYADMTRFGNSVNARPLPVRDVSSGPVVQLAGSEGQYQLKFTLIKGDYRKSGLACYSSSGDKLVFKLEENSGKLTGSVQLPDWKAGRRKINCTAPSSKENGVYFWYSHLWLVKNSDGTWYDE